MKMSEFRTYHSKIIEQYQLIEYHLEGLFGLCGDGDFIELTHRVENDTIGELIRKVRFISKEKRINILTNEDFAILDDIRDSRNYWCHQCYLDIRNNIEIDYEEKIKHDYQIVSDMNLKLRECFMTLKDNK